MWQLGQEWFLEYSAPRCHKLGKEMWVVSNLQRSLYWSKSITGVNCSHDPMDLLCTDFMKVDLSKYGKENVLVMTDAFSTFSVAVVMPNQQAKTVAKALVDKWFTLMVSYPEYSDQGGSFGNKIIKQLCRIYGVKQSTTTPYNPHGNSPCEWLNCMLQNLLKTLPKDKKPNWPAHLGALVFAYNAMPHWTTGYQPYQSMFGCKAQTPCDNWFGWSQYNCNKSISKDSWVQQQYELVWAANKWALKSIWQITQKSTERLNQKSLEIPEGNLVLLCDHLEGCNKIQDRYKSEELQLLACAQSQMYTVSSLSMAMALHRPLITDNSKILGEPRMMEDLPVFRIIMMGYKFPLLIQNQIWPNHPWIHNNMSLAQKEDLQCIP